MKLSGRFAREKNMHVPHEQLWYVKERKKHMYSSD